MVAIPQGILSNKKNLCKTIQIRFNIITVPIPDPLTFNSCKTLGSHVEVIKTAVF